MLLKAPANTVVQTHRGGRMWLLGAVHISAKISFFPLSTAPAMPKPEGSRWLPAPLRARSGDAPGEVAA